MSLTFFITRVRHLPEKLFLIPDAIGLALFAIVGTQVALDWNMPWLTASLLGVLVAVGAGWLFVAGAAIFAFTLYAMAFGAPRWLGAITPIGGTALIIGWLWLAWHALGRNGQ